MDQERFREIDDLIDEHDDLPDGAFFAIMEERGVSINDLADYQREKEDRRRKPRRTQPQRRFKK